LLTPEGRGAVASLVVEGPRAGEFIERHFTGPKAPLAKGRIYVGRWGKTSQEEIVACHIEPERIEVHCHGGAAASQRIIADLVEDGCGVVLWRRWLDLQEPDSIRSAARALLAEARTERTAAILLDQYNGALSRAIDGAIAAIQSGNAASARAQIDILLSRAAVGQHLIDPWRVVLAGPPNAGKSSLINALVGYRRSIVHDSPGTTRDAVSVATALDGWPVELIDTAGLRISNDPLEIAGIDLGRQQIAEADAVLLAFDAAQAWTHELAAMTRQFPTAIIVHNKIDLLHDRNADDPEIALPGRPAGIATSALSGAGVERLIARVVRHLVQGAPAIRDAVPFLPSQIHCLSDARQQIEQTNWAAAVAALRAIINP
jgi:tRNA modification GTPase